MTFDWNLTWLGTHPRHFDEWYTFLTGGLIHGSWKHLINNTFPLFITGFFLILQYGKYSNFIFISTYFFTGLFIFLLARGNTYHIGASGVAYTWAFLLAASGFVRKDRLSLGLGLAVALLFGGMIWGVLPIQKGVSWDGHLIGALTGIFFARILKDINKDDEEKEEIQDGYDTRRFKNSPYKYIRKQLDQNEEN